MQITRKTSKESQMGMNKNSKEDEKYPFENYNPVWTFKERCSRDKL